jgi:uncharacterized membrane protein YeaQ/YmgE (transglycosylase-associated protein family)
MMQEYSWLATIVIGAICGYGAGLIVRGSGLGFIRNVLAGIAGSYVGSLAFAKANIQIAPGIGGTIAIAVIGAVLILTVIGVIRKITA